MFFQNPHDPLTSMLCKSLIINTTELLQMLLAYGPFCTFLYILYFSHVSRDLTSLLDLRPGEDVGVQFWEKNIVLQTVCLTLRSDGPTEETLDWNQFCYVSTHNSLWVSVLPFSRHMNFNYIAGLSCPGFKFWTWNKMWKS